MLKMMMALLIPMSAVACPELNEVDLAGGPLRERTYVELSRKPISLTKKEFLSIPELKEMGYDECKDVISVRKLKVKSNGKIFNAIVSIEDKCDGGNSLGALYSENLLLKLGDISDSTIYCQ